MTKPTIIIFEGADGSGKTSSANLLCENEGYNLLNLSKKTFFCSVNRVPTKIKIDDPQSLTLYLEMLSHIAARENDVLVMDRSIYSNLAYGCSDRNLTKDAIAWMNSAFDIRLIILDRDYVDRDFSDDLLETSKDSFNDTIDWYRDYDGPEKIFRTRLIYDGVFDNLKQHILIDTIMLST